MGIEVSIIIPSYNRFPLNLFTLYSLENQTFNPAKMEVILLDDASTDQTSLLKRYRAPYHFRYIRNSENLGLSKTRNLGVKEAKGNIIIFLDAEIIVTKDFVKTHYLQHQTGKAKVVSFGKFGRMYSYFFPSFSQEQRKDFLRFAKDNPLLRRRLINVLEKKNFVELRRNIEEPIRLLSKKEIVSLDRLKSFSKSIHFPYRFTRQYFKRIPWLYGFGLNHSLKRDVLLSVGGYDEKFTGWGYEDNEFAYRLFKTGVKFVYDPKILLFHQEHPINTNKREREALRNIMYFQRKFPSLEVGLISLRYLKFRGKNNEIVREFHHLQKQAENYKHFIHTLVLILRTVPKLIIRNQPLKQLFSASSISDMVYKKAMQERRQLEKTGRYQTLIRLFDKLIRM